MLVYNKAVTNNPQSSAVYGNRGFFLMLHVHFFLAVDLAHTTATPQPRLARRVYLQHYCSLRRHRRMRRMTYWLLQPLFRGTLTIHRCTSRTEAGDLPWA